MTAPSMTSLAPGYRACVIGSSGGIGAALVAALVADPRCGEVHAVSRRAQADQDPRIIAHGCDPFDEAALTALATTLGAVDLLIIATGTLQTESLRPERSWRELDASAMAEVLRVNLIGPALVARYLLDLLPRDRKAVFAALGARVGSIGDNRLGGWHSYRASKAGLVMLVKTIAIELARRAPQAVALTLHPGTVATPLSAPFAANVAPGQLFTPEMCAAHLLGVIDSVSPIQSGCQLAWDGSEISP